MSLKGCTARRRKARAEPAAEREYKSKYTKAERVQCKNRTLFLLNILFIYCGGNFIRQTLDAEIISARKALSSPFRRLNKSAGLLYVLIPLEYILVLQVLPK